MRRTQTRFTKSVKTTTAVMGMLFWSWPNALLFWSTLVLLPAFVAHMISESYLYALGAAIFVPKLLSSAVFLISYTIDN